MPLLWPRPQRVGTAEGVKLSLELNKPYFTPGEEMSCLLRAFVDKPLVFKAIAAEVICYEKMFSGRSKRTLISHKDSKRISGRGSLRPPRASLGFSMSIPRGAKPTYLGEHLMVGWRIKVRIKMPLTHDLVVSHPVFVIGVFSSEGPTVSSSSRGPSDLILRLRKNVFLPREEIRGTIFSNNPSEIRSCRVELLVKESFRMNPFAKEITRVRCLRKLPLEVADEVRFSLLSPHYSPFRSRYSSASYELRAVASLRRGGDLIASLPILVGFPYGRGEAPSIQEGITLSDLGRSLSASFSTPLSVNAQEFRLNL